MLAIAVAVSIAGLVVGPLVVPIARRAPRGMLILDAVTLALVPGVALTRLLPHLIEDGGLAPVAGLLAGYLGFQLLEARAHRRASTVGVAIVLPALALHALFDGAALGLVLSGGLLDLEAAAFIAAILLHRVPEGLFVGHALRDAQRTSLWLAVAVLALVTVLGAAVGGELVEHVPHEVANIGISVGLGIMVRMVIDRHGPPAAADRTARATSGLAFVACVVLVLVTPNHHDLFGSARAHELSVGEALVPLFLETAPLLLAALAVTELVAWYVPDRSSPHRVDPWVTSAFLGGVLLGPVVAAIRVLTSAVTAIVARRSPCTASWWVPRARFVLPLYAVGVLVAAIGEAVVPSRFLVEMPLVVATLTASLIGIWIPLGAGAPVLAAVIAHKGAPLPAALALIVASALRAGTSTTRARWMSVVGTTALAPLLATLAARSPLRELHDLGAHEHALYEWGCGAALAVWITIDLVRAGPRFWLTPDTRRASLAARPSPPSSRPS